jgi:hypothetical protein
MGVAQCQAELGDQCVPKLELGNEGRKAFDRMNRIDRINRIVNLILPRSQTFP